jgi:uncharacterized protein involved in exopolysaccharide biosynthesis
LFLEAALSQQIAESKLSQTGANPDTLAHHLGALQDQLAALRTRYTNDHPDVVKIKNEIAQLQQRMKEEGASAQEPSDARKLGLPIDTAQAQQLRAQLHQIDVNIQERTAEQSRLQQEIKRVQAKLELTPAVAQQYKALTRDYQTALNIYNDFLKKQNDSEVSRDLVRRQQGEQFRVLDPPSLPQEPIFPNRRLFAFGGLAAGLGFGLGIAVLLETQDTTLRTENDVEHLLKLPTLAVIPAVTPTRGNGKDAAFKTGVKTSKEPVDQNVGSNQECTKPFLG